MEFPRAGDTTNTTAVSGGRVFVVVGANGSGKTRLGTWLEFKSSLSPVAHRVSAQKSLTMPTSVSPRSLSEAEAHLRYGYATGQLAHKDGHRWNSNPNTSLLSDFDKLMVYLFSEDYEKSISYRRAAFAVDQRVEPPPTKLDTVKRIWEAVLPQRELVIGSGTITTRLRGSTQSYSGSEMSDGERVVFYLIGECLAAPENGLLIIDEPELHLHKSIQAMLWDAIEGERDDLTFIYLTHDLGFAASRIEAPKICLRSFDGTNWDWFVAPSDSQLPEEVLLQIVGSRKPVLFIEGDDGSLDRFLFRHCYPDFTIVPAGSCTHVIHAVATFAAFKHLHHVACRGIIDRDFREDDDVAHLAGLGISVLNVAAIENVLLTTDVLGVVATAMHRDDAAETIGKVQEMVFTALTRDIQAVASRIVATQLENTFGRFESSAIGRKDLSSAVDSIVARAQVDDRWAKAIKRVETILAERDYPAALSIYKNKGLLPQAGIHFGLMPREYVRLVKKLLVSKENGTIATAVRKHVPGIPLSTKEQDSAAG